MKTLLQEKENRFSQATIDEFDEDEHEDRRDAHAVASEHSDDGGDELRAPVTRHYQRLQRVDHTSTFQNEGLFCSSNRCHFCIDFGANAILRIFVSKLESSTHFYVS